MEDGFPLQSRLGETTVKKLLSAAQWARVYGSILCVFSGMGLIGLLFTLTALASFSSAMGGKEAGLFYLALFLYLIVLAFMLYLNVQLVFFGRDVKAGVYGDNEALLEVGFSRLARYFKIISILMISLIVMVVFVYALVLAAGIGGATDTPPYPKNHF